MTVEILGSGTSQGVPVIACNCEVCSSKDPKDDRMRSAIWIHNTDTSIVVDTGPDFRRQMLNHSVDHLDATIITHGHADHTVGMDDLRTFNFLQNRHMNIYAYPETLEDVANRFSYAFGKSDYPGVPLLTPKEVGVNPFTIGSLDIQPIPVLHRGERVMGLRIDDFAYITDANEISEASREQLKGTKILVLNALRREPHYSHFTLSEALAIIEELKVEQAYLTHISHLIGKHADVEVELPNHVGLCYDGQIIDL